MKKSTHPEWALKFKRPGTELRNINNRYYLYEISSKWDKEKKRSKKITGRLLGSITEEKGFKESDKYNLSKTHFSEPLQVKEYGASSFICSYFSDYFEKLKVSFPEIWQDIVSLSFIRLLYHSTIKDTAFWFEKSFLSEIYSGITLGDKRVSALYRKIGTDRQTVTSFMKKFIKEDDCIIFDGTQFISYSKQIDEAKVGYSSKQNFEPQMNILFLFSINHQKPVFYRLLPGNITDVKAFKLTMQEADLKDATVIGDKGFYSEDNIETLDNFGLNYVIPLRRKNTMIDYSPIKDTNNHDFDGYFEHQKRFIWYKKTEIENKNVFLFLDKQLKSQEENDYLTRINTHPESYTIQNFKEKSFTFGTFSVITNLADKTAEDIYKIYKTRGDIETMIDAMKNVLCLDKSYMQNEAALQGWMFITYIAIQWYYEIYMLIQKNELTSKYSPKELLMHLSEIKKIKINQNWVLSEFTNKTQKILDKLNIHIT
jgi:transposase